MLEMNSGHRKPIGRPGRVFCGIASTTMCLAKCLSMQHLQMPLVSQVRRAKIGAIARYQPSEIERPLEGAPNVDYSLGSLDALRAKSRETNRVDL